MSAAPTGCEGCGAPEPAQQCPKCRELGLPPSYFCTQACFKTSWAKHKAKHSAPPACTINTMTDQQRLMFEFRGSIRPGKITPKRPVPATIARPDYANDPQGRSKSEESSRNNKIHKYPKEEYERVKEICRLSREVLDIGVAAAKVGVTTDEVDRVVHEATIERGMYPSPLNYYNFPKSVCTSVNEIICHGIPDSRELQEGDILNIDVSSFRDAVHADLNETIFVGRPDADTIRLVNCAYECLYAGIATVKPDSQYRFIGDAITDRADLDKCSVVRTYSGHGVGEMFHTAPSVPHYRNNKAPGIIKQGHIFTIEPMINLGVWQDVTWPDNWTSSTLDGSRSAQFEHTMYVTSSGVELLTDWKDSIPHFKKQLADWHIPVPAPLVAKKEEVDES